MVYQFEWTHDLFDVLMQLMDTLLLFFVLFIYFIYFLHPLQNRLGPLMIILKEHIIHMEKDQLNNHQSELTSFFLSALDFRAQHCQVLYNKFQFVLFFNKHIN